MLIGLFSDGVLRRYDARSLYMTGHHHQATYGRCDTGDLGHRGQTGIEVRTLPHVIVYAYQSASIGSLDGVPHDALIKGSLLRLHARRKYCGYEFSRADFMPVVFYWFSIQQPALF